LTRKKADGTRKPVPPFGAEWGPQAEAWTTLAKGLGDEDWKDIIEEVTSRLEAQGIKSESVMPGSASAGSDTIDDSPDPRTVIDI